MKKSTLSVERCKTISTVQKILGGKWKIEIIYYIAFQNIHRFGELRRHIGDITESSLEKQLRELEADGFIEKYKTLGRRKPYCTIKNRITAIHYFTQKNRRSVSSLLTKLPAVYISSIIEIKRS